MLKKTQVCAFKFVRPQKVSLSAKSRFYLQQTWWEWEDGKREHLLAYEVDKRHDVAAGDLVLTPKPAPVVFLGQQKSRYEYHRLATSSGEGCFWTVLSSHSSAQLAAHSWGGNQKSWLASQGERVTSKTQGQFMRLDD